MKLVLQHYNTLEEFQNELIQSQYRDVKVLQVSDGLFVNAHKATVIGSTTLVDRFMKNAYIQSAKLDKGICRIILPYRCAPIVVNGNSISENRLLFWAPEEELCLTGTENTRAVVISVDAEKLKNYVYDEDLDGLLSRAPLLRSQDGLGDIAGLKSMLIHFSHAVFSQVHAIPVEAEAELEEAVLLMLEHLLRSENQSWKVPATASRYAIIRRALDYLERANGESVSVLTLSQKSCCSVRALEYAFKNNLNMSPKKYLNIRKMHQIRICLIQGNATNISDLLKSYGVINKGRFSRDYSQLFGEYPKETLGNNKKGTNFIADDTF